MTFSKYIVGCLSGLVMSLGASAATAEVVAVVSARSAVTALNQHQLVDLFLGKLSRLPNGQTVTPIDQPEGAPARDEFYDRYAGKSAAQVKAHWAKIIFTGRGQPPVAASGPEDLKKRLADNPNAVGYIDREAVDDSVRILSIR